VTAVDTGNDEGVGEGGRREHELLLLCARATADEATTQAIRRLAGEGLDFEYLFRLAHRHLVLRTGPRRRSSRPPSSGS
jgi:hypothetical protein